MRPPFLASVPLLILLGIAQLSAQEPARSVEVSNIARQGGEISIELLGLSTSEWTHTVEYSPTMESASWDAHESTLTEEGENRFRLTLSIDPDIQGFFRVRSQSAPGGTGDASQVVINEIASNNDGALLDGDGDTPDWIELLNAGESTVDLSGHGLSDRIDRPSKWIFPENTVLASGEFLLVYASGKEGEAVPDGELHVDFRIGNGEEPVVFSDPDGNIIDRLYLGPLASDASLGRARDNVETLYVFEPKQATPGAPNHGFLFGAPDPYIQAPQFSVDGGIHDGPVTLTLIAPLEGDVIRFTTNGAEPFHTLFNSNSSLYSEPIVFDQPTVIRAKIFGPNQSRTVSRTYLVGIDHALPVLSMATEPEHFEFENGYLYGMSPALSANGSVTGNYPYSSSNAWRREREIEASLEMFEPDGDEGLAMNVGVKIFGGWGSRGYPQKSLAIFARQEYGYGRIRHQLFPAKDIDSFESFVLRNSGNDNQSTWLTYPRTEIKAFGEPQSYGSYFVNGNFTLFRDAMIQSLAAETGLDTQAYRPAVLYLNGDYWGIYNIREKMTEHYVESNHGVPGDEIDLIEGYGVANTGSSTTYNAMRNFVSSRDMNDPEHYQFVEDTYLDIANFIDYHLTVIWCQNFDIGNIKCWRPQRDEGGQFRWLVYDQDYGFNLWKPEVYLPAMKRDFSDYENMFTFYTNPAGNGTGWPNAGGRTMLLREMLESDRFREQFIQRCADLLNHLWSGDRVVGRIDAMASVIRPEIPRHLERWSWAAIQERGFGHPHKEEDEPLDLAHWERNVEVMRGFGRHRPEQLREQLMEHFDFQNGAATVAVTIRGSDKGSVKINTLTVPSDAWSGVYFKDLPLTVTAIPQAGHSFAGWSGALGGTELEMTLPLATEDVELIATFE